MVVLESMEPMHETTDLQTLVSRLQAENADLRARMSLKDERIEKLLRQLFGKSSERRILSEQGGPEQLSLILTETEIPAQSDSSLPTEIEIKGHKRRSKKISVEGLLDQDGKFPAELPRVEETLDEGEGEIITVKVTERLEIDPPRLFVRTIRRVVRKKADGSISQPCVPEVITARSTVGASFLAFIIVSKVLWHQPLHRQEHMLRQYGVKISKDRLIRYVIDVASLLRPLYRLLLASIVEQEKVFADETPALVGKRGEGGKKFTTSYFWPLLAGNQLAVVYSPTRKGTKIKEILKDFVGFLQVDGYRVYEQFAKVNKRVQLVLC